MIEYIALTCFEATKLIDKIENHRLPVEIKKELIAEVLSRSECKDGNV